MKKKIVAFAVTAVMLVTSAVPVFAVSGWGETTQVENENPNVVVVDDKGITTEKVKGDIEDGISFSTVVDLNNCKSYGVGNTLTFSLNYSQDKSLELVLKKTSAANADPAVYEAQLGGTGEKATGLSGICAFDWTVDKDGVTVEVQQYGKASTAVKTMTVEGFPENVTGVISLHAQASANKHIMYVDYPENIKSVRVVDSEGEVATQPVAGETYKIDGITLDYNTVLSAEKFDLNNYVNVEWTATKNGKTETIGTGLSCKIEDSDKTKGAVIGVTVTYKDGSGIFGTVSWGSGNAPLAVAERISGATRYETAINVAEKLRNTLSGKRFNAVLVADGTDFADALSGTALAYVENAPILLVNGETEDMVVEYINKHMDYQGKVYILGGTSAVSADFEKAVEKFDEVRLGGATRYDTNIAILKQIAEIDKENGENHLKDIAVCAGLNYPDALSVSATGMPVLLVGSALTAEQDEYLKSIKSVNDMYYVIGGTTAVSAGVESDLRSLDYVEDTTTGASADVVRLAGETRYETNEMVVDKFFENKAGKTAYIAYGLNYADALTGGALAAHTGCPLLLVNVNDTDAASKIIKEKKYDMTVIGGVNAVSAETVQKIYNAANAA